MKSSEFKKRMIFNAILIISLVVTVASMSFAWFTQGDTNEVSEINLSLPNVNEFLISKDNSHWQRTLLDLDIDQIEFNPISSDGTKFFKPNYSYQQLESTSREIIYGNLFIGYTEMQPSEYSDYFFQNIYYFKASYDCDLAISTTSSFEPYELVANSERRLNGLETTSDVIVGAIRMSIAVKIGQEFVTKLIWVPKPNYQLTETSFILNGTPEDRYRFRHTTTNNYDDVTPLGLDSKNTKTSSGIIYLIGDVIEDVQFAQISSTSVTEIKISIWLDGEDRECKESLSGGKFKVNLDFSGL